VAASALEHPREYAPVRIAVEAPRPAFYAPQLDVVRFFAFFVVFVGHSFPVSARFYEQSGVPHGLAVVIAAALTCGSFGVDLFFVLSSYLITALLLREIGWLGRVDVRAFYIRRALRIWPLYFLFVLGYFFLQASVPKGGFRGLDGTALVMFLLFVGNFAVVAQPMIQVSHLWSVSIEEQFYLIWAVAMRWVSVARLPAIASAALALSLASRVVLLVAGAGFVAIWCSSITRLDALAMGVLLATGTVLRAPLRRPWTWIAGSVVAVVAMQVVLPVERRSPYVSLPIHQIFIDLAIVAGACTVIVRAALDTRPGRGALARALTYLGKISYGLYVFHPLALAFVRSWAPPRSLVEHAATSAGALALTVLVSALSYEAYERRFLALKQRFTRIASRPL
jgi:peptidoglycan/LPS O-acetylase OafA/YrhL